MLGVVCGDGLLHFHHCTITIWRTLHKTLGSFTPSPGNLLLVLLLPDADADAGDTKF